MLAVAPNLTVLVGELVGARLISHAGSLLNLAKHPSSTVQILGAEKALFRAMKTKHDTPKYGLIYHASLVGQTSAKLKGKVSRMLAAKAALAIRVDALGEDTDASLGTEQRADLEKKFALLEQNSVCWFCFRGKKRRNSFSSLFSRQNASPELAKCKLNLININKMRKKTNSLIFFIAKTTFVFPLTEEKVHTIKIKHQRCLINGTPILLFEAAQTNGSRVETIDHSSFRSSSISAFACFLFWLWSTVSLLCVIVFFPNEIETKRKSIGIFFDDRHSIDDLFSRQKRKSNRFSSRFHSFKSAWLLTWNTFSIEFQVVNVRNIKTLEKSKLIAFDSIEQIKTVRMRTK